MSDNCLKTNFTKRDATSLLLAISSRQNINDWITNNYNDEIGSILRNIVFDESNLLRPLPEIIKSLMSLKTPDNIPGNTQSFNPNYQPDAEKSALSPEADFIRLGNMSSLDYAKMEKDFQREVMRAAFLTEEGELKDLNNVGRNLLKYRLELAKKLWKYLYPAQEFPTNINNAKLINTIVSVFENTTQTRSFNNYRNYYSDYMKLKHFDALLKKFDFIKKNIKYAQNSEIEEDTYDSGSIFGFKEKGSAYDEDASSEDYTTEFIKQLISCFDRPSRFGGRVPLDFASYNASLQIFYRWAENQNNDLYKKILYSGIEQLLSNNDNTNIIFLLQKFVKDPVNRQYIEVKNVIRGIIDMLKKPKLDWKVKLILGNLINTEVGYNYTAVRLESDRTTMKQRNELLKVTTKLLESQIINREMAKCKNSLINKIMLFRENYSEFLELKKKYGIKIERGQITINAQPDDNEEPAIITPWRATESNGIQKIAESTPIKIKITVSDNGGTPTYKFAREENKSSGLTTSNLNPEFIINFINDFTGLQLDESDIDAFHDVNSGNLFSTFATMAYVVLTASEGNSINKDTGAAIGNAFENYKWLFGIQPFIDNYYEHISIPADYLASKYGTENRTVMKNGEGNNLPTSQLRSSIFDTKWKIYSMKNRTNLPRRNNQVQETASNPYAYNLLYNNAYLIGNPIARADVKIGNKTKQVQNLTLKECFDWAILSDFYFNLFSEINNPNAEYDKTSNPFYGKIVIQPMEYADKKRLFTIPIDVKNMNISINGKVYNVRELLRTMGDLNISSTSRNNAKTIFLQDFFTRTGNKYREIARRLLVRYSDIYNLGYTLQNLQTNEQIQAAKIAIEDVLKGKSQYEILSDARKKKIDIYNESDFDVTNHEFFDKFNSTLFFLTDTFSDFGKFRDFFIQNQVLGLKSLIKSGFTLDGSVNPSLNSYLKSLNPSSEFASWIDPVTNEIELFRVYDPNGNKVNIDPTNIDDLDQITTGEFSYVVNPIIDSYFIADTVFSNYYADIAMGDVYGFAAKHKLKPTHPGYMEEDIGSRYLMMTKRAVPMGGTRITFTQGLKEGVPDMMNLAIVEDILAPAFNHMGNSDDYTSQDGSAWKSPYFSRMQNASLPGREGGNRRMKTLCNWTDSETATMGLLKFAEYVITNEDRRNSQFSDMNLELLFKKMHSNKIKPINLQQYYSSTPTAKSFGKTIYRKFPELRGAVDKLVKIENNPEFPYMYTATWERRNGDSIQTITETHDTSTIYGIDQLFGGAYAGELDANNRFINTEINTDMIYNILCEEDLKKSFIHMTVNHSAIKAGVKNLNPSSVYSDDSELTTFEAPTKQYGMQGNKDHEVDDPRGVREMSQLINSLTQDDLLPDEANVLYDLIGTVVSNALGKYRTALEGDNPEEVYKLLGKAFVKSLQQNGRSSLGLASAFAANATQDLLTGNLKTKIPFSANTLKGIFQAAISSTLNNDALMRRFAGMGGVETPSYGVLQYFEINGKKLNADELLSLVGDRELVKQYLTDPMFVASPTGFISNNPYVVPIGNTKPGFEDTIIILHENGKYDTVKLDTVEKRDSILNRRNFLPTDRIFNWTIKPKNLKGSETFVVVDGKQYSIFDFDVPRALSYLKQDINTLDTTQKDVIFSAIDEIRDAGVLKEDEILDTFGASYINLDNLNVKKLQNRFVWYILNVLDPKLQEANNYEPIEFKTQKAWNNPNPISIIQRSWVQSTEGAIGKRDANKLGIRLGDTINDIKSQKENFFKNRLNELMPDPKIFEIDKNDYDAVVYTSEGKPIFVVIGNQDSNRVKNLRERIGNKLITNLDFPSVAGEYWNGDVNYGSTENKIFKSYQTSTGKLDYVFVDNYDAFQELLDNDAIIGSRYNYTTDNFASLMVYNFEHNGVVSFRGVNYEITENPDGTPNIRIPQDSMDIQTLCKLLNIDDSKRRNKYINKLAENRYKSAMLLFQAIMDRIPSQSLQSCAAMDIVMLLDTFENVANVSHMLAWLQGSDFDIDVEYTLFYELGNNGVVITPSFLDRFYDPNDVLTLPMPTGKTYTFDQSQPGVVLNLSDYNMFELGTIIPIRKILESKQTNIRFEGLTNDQIIQFERQLNRRLKLHERSINASSDRRAAGLRNLIVHKLNKFLKSPIVQGRREISIDDSMKDFRKAIPEEKNGQEVKRSPFNPISKFETQVSNMSGKDGVGIGAAGEKNYFITHRTHSADLKLINNLLQEYYNNPDDDLARLILDQFQFVVTNALFKASAESPDMRAVANLSIKRAFGDYSKLQNIFVPDGYKFGSRSSIMGDRYIVNNEFLLSKFLADLDMICNGTPDNVVNATNAHSGNISLATDNAKYLDLDKMNNTSKFGDIYVYLISSGISPKDMVTFMTSPVFDICARFSYDDISNPNTSWFNLENAVNFVLDRKPLPIIQEKILQKAILDGENKSTNSGVTTSFIHDFFMNEQIRNLGLGEYVRLINRILNNTGKRVSVAANESLSNVYNLFIEAIDNLKADKNNWTENSQQIIQNIYSLLADFYTRINNNSLAEITVNILLNNLRTKFVNTKSLESNRTGYSNDDVERMLEDQILQQQYDLEGSTDEGDVNAFFNVTQNFGGKLNSKELQNAYKYIKNYLMVKNRLVSKLVDNQWRQKLEMLANVIQAVNEMKANSNLLGINSKGLTTNDYEEYSKIESFNKFINDRYFKFNKEFVPFDLVKFLLDEQEQQLQIKQYEQVKSSENILHNIIGTPHFKEMLTALAVNRHLISYSAAIDLERKLAKKLVKINSDPNSLTEGDSKSLSKDEFRELQRYVSDLLIVRWIQSQQNLDLKIPKGQASYERIPGNNLATLTTSKIGSRRISLNNLDGLASFKRLMDLYVIPRMKTAFSKNYFVQNLKLWYDIDKKTIRFNRGYGLDFDTKLIDDSPVVAEQFDRLVKGFNEIKNVKLSDSVPALRAINGNYPWTIGELFWLYNLVTYKDGFGSKAFTKVFEDMNLNSGIFSVMGSYYDFLGKLDSKEIDDNEIFANELQDSRTKSESKTDKASEENQIKLKDLRYRIASDTNGNKIKTTLNTETEDGRTKVTGVNFFSGDSIYSEEKVVGDQEVQYTTSDYTFNMPFTTGFVFKTAEVKPEIKKVGETIKLQEWTKNPSVKLEVYQTISEFFQERFGFSPIKFITNDSFSDQEFRDQLGISEDEVDRYSRANAFISGNDIYVNLDNANLDAPIHEYMHIVMALMKYSANTKAVYYNLLNKISDLSKTENEYSKLIQSYQQIYPNTWKEEVLVQILGDKFRLNLESQIEDSDTGKEWFVNDVLTKMNEMLVNILGISDETNLDKLVEDFRTESSDKSINISDFTVKLLFNMLGSKKFGAQTNADGWKRAVGNSEYLQHMKDKLEITYNGDC